MKKRIRTEDTKGMKNRDYVVFYVNGKRIEVRDERIFLPLANFLRYENDNTGTKIVCAEGDCGACTVLQAKPKREQLNDVPLDYISCNSCILPVFLLDSCSVITVEGMELSQSQLDPIQESFVRCNASQCGFCTPGFIMATASLYEKKSQPTKKDVQNYLTGNLCRCTGYDSIIQAGCDVENANRNKLQDRYFDPSMTQDLLNHSQKSIYLDFGEQCKYFAPTSLSEAVTIHAEHKTKIISGATDLGVQINKGRYRDRVFLDLRFISEMHEIIDNQDSITVGAKVNWEMLRRVTKSTHPKFSEFLHLFASPQIKNVGTLVGNIANASPIADSTPYLMMAEALLHLKSIDGERQVPIVDFYKGYKDLNMQEHEFITHITIPKPKREAIIKLYKISARRDLDISCVNMAARMEVNEGIIVGFRLAYGGVGPVVKRIYDVENFLIGKDVNPTTIQKAIEMIPSSITPISDVRGSMTFRYRSAQNLLKKFFFEWQRENPNRGSTALSAK